MAALRILLLYCALASGLGEPINTWQDLLVSEAFNRFLHSFADKKGVDIIVGGHCQQENDVAAFNSFVKGIRVPLAMWTRGFDRYIMKRENTVGMNIKRMASSVLALVCDFYDVLAAWPQDDFRHFFAMTAYMLTPALNGASLTREQMAAKRRQAELGLFSDALNVTAVNGKVYVTDIFTSDCISCNPSEPIRKPLFRDMPLSGSALDIQCYGLYCDDVNIITLRSTLEHRNATIRTVPVYGRIPPDSLRKVFRGTGIEAFSALDWIHANKSFVVAGYYDAYSVEYFIKGRLPLAKEVVLFLPFTWQVWCAFISCVACCALLIALILLRKGRRLSVVDAVGAFVFIFLRQPDQLPPSLLRHHSIRMVLGLWAIAALVLSTGFQGALTSLLRNIPLESGVEVFSSDLFEKGGYRECQLTYRKSDESGQRAPGATQSGVFTPIRPCVNLNDLLHKENHKLILTVDNIHSTTAVEDRNNISRAGFVRLPPVVHKRHIGPRLLPVSPYRRAVAQTVTRALEAGLYVRARALFSFNASLWSQSFRVLRSSEEDSLSLSDMRPYFLVWAAGIALSTVVFLLEVITFRLKEARTFRKARAVILAARRRLKMKLDLKRDWRKALPQGRHGKLLMGSREITLAWNR